MSRCRKKPTRKPFLLSRALTKGLLAAEVILLVGAARPQGTELPPGGGEPGKAYLEYHEAVRKQDLDRLRTRVDAEWLGLFELIRARQHGAGTERDALAALLEAQASEPVVVGGSVNGKHAELAVEGRVLDRPVQDMVRMVLEQDGWKVGDGPEKFLVLDALSDMGVVGVWPDETGLPPGGGEPGKAYLDFQKAIQEQDQQLYLKLLDADWRALLELFRRTRSEYAKAEPAALAALKEFQPMELKVVGGAISGDRAKLIVEGKQFIEPTSGTAVMVLEQDGWKVVRGDTRWIAQPIGALSDQTLATLRELKEPVQVLVYLGPPSSEHLDRIWEMLSRFRAASGGNLIVEVVEPYADRSRAARLGLDKVDTVVFRRGEAQDGRGEVVVTAEELLQLDIGQSGRPPRMRYVDEEVFRGALQRLASVPSASDPNGRQ